MIQHNDGRGNVTGLGIWSFSYDAENRLIQAAQPGTTITFHYDPTGRLVKRVTNGIAEYFTYDGIHVILRHGDADQFQASMVWGPKTNEALVEYTPQTSYKYFHLDSTGSTVAVTNGGKAVLEFYRYSAFGVTSIYGPDMALRSSTQCNTRNLFCAQEYFAALGVYNFRARAYSPTLGRFLQNDPSGLSAGDTNLYRYAWNSPLKYVDLLGLHATTQEMGSFPSIFDEAETDEGSGSVTATRTRLSSVLVVGYGASATGFLGNYGVTLGTNASMLSNGQDSFVQVGVSIAPLFGGGGAAFFSTGPSFGVSDVPTPGFTVSETSHAEAGLGLGSVASGSIDWDSLDSFQVSPMTSLKVWSPKAGGGVAAYVAKGKNFTAQFTIPQSTNPAYYMPAGIRLPPPPPPFIKPPPPPSPKPTPPPSQKPGPRPSSRKPK